MNKEQEKEFNNEPRICTECGREIYFMEMEALCEACAIGISGGFRERPTVETLKEVYWKLNEKIPQLLASKKKQDRDKYIRELESIKLVKIKPEKFSKDFFNKMADWNNAKISKLIKAYKDEV